MACGDNSIAAPDPAAALLAGRWEREPYAMEPTGRLEYALTFTAPNRFTWDIRGYGIMAGQPADEVSFYSRIDGQYATHGALLEFTPRRAVSWDRFYGANSRERREDPATLPPIFDQATFNVEADKLTIRFVSYPADAPVPVQSNYSRAP